jgi:hypothetical protein
MKSAHHNEDNNPCKMLSDAFQVRRNRSFGDEVPILQAEDFDVVNPSFLIMQKEIRTYGCA